MIRVQLSTELVRDLMYPGGEMEATSMAAPLPFKRTIKEEGAQEQIAVSVRRDGFFPFLSGRIDVTSNSEVGY
jgi:hypothetical protein